MKRCVVVGAGLIGMGTALALKRLSPGLSVRVLEKEAGVGRHQSTHNSGVLHAGLYYKPGSLKARLAVQGIRQMVAYCRQHGVAHEVCGKLVVATDEQEVVRLRNLLERGTQNGLHGLRWLGADELREVEPHVAGIAALHVPEEGIVDYAAVCNAMQRDLVSLGAEVSTSAGFDRVHRDGTGWRVSTTAGEVEADFLVNCAGLQCDRVAAACGEERRTRIVPFRGEYYELQESARHLVRNLIYPVPDPVFPFLGVHFTRMIHGGIEAGPNAVLALAREGYKNWQFNLADTWDALGYRGLWAFMRKHRGMAWDEIVRSLSRAAFCRSLQRLVPAVQLEDLRPGQAGVRAQAMQEDGTLVQDFEIIQSSGALHLLNAPSPGATASIAIGEYIASMVLSAAGGRE